MKGIRATMLYRIPALVWQATLAIDGSAEPISAMVKHVYATPQPCASLWTCYDGMAAVGRLQRSARGSPPSSAQPSHKLGAFEQRTMSDFLQRATWGGPAIFLELVCDWVLYYLRKSRAILNLLSHCTCKLFYHVQLEQLYFTSSCLLWGHSY